MGVPLGLLAMVSKSASFLFDPTLSSLLSSQKMESALFDYILDVGERFL
jgi:hypothetical protein